MREFVDQESTIDATFKMIHQMGKVMVDLTAQYAPLPTLPPPILLSLYSYDLTI